MVRNVAKLRSVGKRDGGARLAVAVWKERWRRSDASRAENDAGRRQTKLKAHARKRSQRGVRTHRATLERRRGAVQVLRRETEPEGVLVVRSSRHADVGAGPLDVAEHVSVGAAITSSCHREIPFSRAFVETPGRSRQARGRSARGPDALPL